MPPENAPSGYPVSFAVDYPDRPLNRLTTFFRAFMVIPLVILLAAIGGAGILFLPVLLIMLFRKKYPRWWFDWNLNYQRFMSRIGAYLLLMDDRYPSTDEEQAVHLEYPVPDAAALSRGLPLVKWLLAIPHLVVLFFLEIGLLFAVVFAWFAILFTGRYPRGVFTYAEGVLRWHNRVMAYAITLVTDSYPPFTLKP